LASLRVLWQYFPSIYLFWSKHTNSYSVVETQQSHYTAVSTRKLSMTMVWHKRIKICQHLCAVRGVSSRDTARSPAPRLEVVKKCWNFMVPAWISAFDRNDELNALIFLKIRPEKQFYRRWLPV